jgi:hypothetical protein
VQQKPQRPFVPHRTPKSSAGVSSDSEFRLSRPFVPGAEPAVVVGSMAVAAVEVPTVESEREPVLRGIEEFVESLPEIAEATAYVAPESHGSDFEESYRSQLEDDDYELPPIEHFTDPLPAVETFAPESEWGSMGRDSDAMDYGSVGTSPPVPGSAGWVDEEWQRFDWRAAAALGDAPDAQASNDWAATDWDAAAPNPRERRPSAAQEIAKALDHIAQRIRDGELPLPSPGDLGDPTALAAKLAALLGVRS